MAPATTPHVPALLEQSSLPTAHRSRLRRTVAYLLLAGVLVGATGGQPAAQAATGDPTSTAPVRGTATAKATIRAAAKADAKVLGSLEVGQRIPTTAVPADGWVRVRFRHHQAYVAAQQLTTGTEVPPAPATIRTTGTKVATAKLEVRSGPSTADDVVGRVDEGDTLKLTGRLSHGYAETRFAGKGRWVSVLYLATAQPKSRAEKVLAFAKKQLGKPYKYGATGPKAYDCSGLTQASYEAAGVTIPRTAAQQSTFGTKVKKSKLKAGDLVFFYGSKPSHVAIYVGDGKVIHAPRPGKKVEYLKMSSMPYSGARRPG